MQQHWNKRPLWAPADGDTGGEDRIAALESRLARMTGMLSNLVDTQANDRVRNQISQVEHQILTKIRETEATESQAERELAEAFDGGDGATAARAQRVLTEATASRIEAQNDLRSYRARVVEGEKRQGGSDGSPQLDTTNLDNWKQRHASWYGVDKEMTAKAHQIDAQVRGAGVHAVGSVDYFNAIDREMRRLYPDKLSGTPSTTGGGSVTNPTSFGGRISAAVTESWRRMGIDTSDPKVLTRMMKHRELLVGKGILTPQPITSAIRTA